MAQLGSIEIPVEVTDKKLQSELDKSKRKIEKFDKDTEKMTDKKAKLDIDATKTMADLQKVDNKIEEINARMADMERTNIPQNLSNNSEYQGLISQSEYLNTKGQEYLQKLEFIKSSQSDITQKIEETKKARGEELQNLNNLVKRADDYKNKSEGINLSNLNESLDKHQKKLSGIISKVGRWALAVFGVRSMYNLVRQSASTIAQYDKKIGADIEYIRFALAYTLKPVVEWLIKAAYHILRLIGAIIYQITGKNIFKNSGAGAYEKAMKSSAKSTGKMAKDSKKIKDNFSAGFDEFTALQEKDTSSSGSSGGAGGGDFTLPTEDLSKGIENMQLPPWAQKIVEIGKWIVANKDIVLKVIGVLLSLLAFNKVISWITPLANIFGLMGGQTGKTAVSTLGSTVGKLGVIAGGLTAIALINDKVSKDNIEQSKQLTRMAEKGYEYAQKDSKEFKNINEMADALNTKRKTGREVLLKTYSVAADFTKQSDALLTNAKSSIEQQDLYLQEQIKQYHQGNLNKEEQDKLKQLLIEQRDYLIESEDILDAHGEDTQFIRDMSKQYRDVLGEIDPKIKRQNELWDSMWPKTKKNKETTKDIAKEISKGAEDLTNMAKTKLPDKKMKVNVEADTKKANTTLGSLLKTFGENAAKVFNASGLKETASNIWKKISGIKLASGGIVNMPGKGVPVGAIAGEAGAEAVIPLNDETMERLGSAIARHMSVNLTNINQMNGRTISRELQKIMNEESFSGNR